MYNIHSHHIGSVKKVTCAHADTKDYTGTLYDTHKKRSQRYKGLHRHAVTQTYTPAHTHTQHSHSHAHPHPHLHSHPLTRTHTNLCSTLSRCPRLLWLAALFFLTLLSVSATTFVSPAVYTCVCMCVCACLSVSVYMYVGVRVCFYVSL